MTATINNVARQTLTEMAYDEILRAIETGLLKAGEKINESTLAKNLGISRFPVREALRALEKIGLVTFEPFKGVRVTPVTNAHMKDILQVHFSLEEMSIRLMMTNLTPERLAVLDGCILGMRQSTNTVDLINADLGFHKAVCTFSGNGPLLTTWLPLASHIRVCMHAGVPLFDDREDFIQAHAGLLDFIKSGDVEQAVLAMRRHFHIRIDNLTVAPELGLAEA